MGDFNGKADLEVNLKGLGDLISQASKAATAGEDLDKVFERIQKTFTGVEKQATGLNRQLKDLTTASSQATKNLGPQKGTAEEWSKVSDAIRQAKSSDAGGSLIATRYALYDVATTYGAIGAAALGASGLAIKSASDMEAAFADVKRTADPAAGGVNAIRQSLVDLSSTTQTSFADLSKIATLGNQLGVASGDLLEFTKVVNEFSISSGMTADASATAFGKLSNLLHVPISQARNLGSAIELVGVNSAATDQEIIALTQRLAATATRAGFTADQIVGLSGALGSLGVAPERAQGVFETYFNSLNSALAEGGDKMELFAAITGRTSDQLMSDVNSGGGFGVFKDFLSTLQTGNNVQFTQALDALGLSGLRANEVIGRISQNLPLLEQSFATASKGFQEGTELTRQFGIKADTLQAKLQMLGNALMNLASVGVGNTGGLKDLVQLFTDIVNGVRNFVSTDIGGYITRTVLTVTLLTGAWFAYKSMNALATASTYALITAQQQLAASSTTATGGVLGLFRAVTGLGGAGRVGAAGLTATAAASQTVASTSVNAARGAEIAKTALLGLGRATIILGLLQVATELIFNFGGAMQWLQQPVNFVLDLFTGLSQAVLGTISSIMNAIGMIPGAGVFKDWGKAVLDQANSLSQMNEITKREWGNFVRDVKPAETSVDDLTKAMDSLPFDGTAAGAGDLGNALGDMGDSAAGAAAEVRTLVDYANDLDGVMKRAFNIRFGNGQAFDEITSGWHKIADASAQAAEDVAKYRQELADLTADKSIKEYWLSVAENYGDTLRAAKLRAELSDLSNQQADANKNLSKAQDKASMSLTGNSDAAIENRASLLGLLGNYQDLLKSYAANGMGQDELAVKAEQLKQEFIQQAVQMGFNRAEVDKYAQSFVDITKAINAVPRNVTVTANADPAIQALNEFVARAGTLGAQAGANFGNGFGGGVGGSIASSMSNNANILSLVAQYNEAMAQAASNAAFAAANVLNPAAFATGMALYNTWLSRAMQLRAWGGFASGGYTGDGGKYDVAGVVHRGEYVFTKEQTKAWGVQNLHQMAKGYAPAGLGAVGAGGGGIFELSAYDRALLQEIADRVGLSITERTIQGAANASNANSAMRRGA